MERIDTEDLGLRIYPDPILKKHCIPFTKPFPENIAEVGEAMQEVMYEENGIGLAGPQMGLSRRIIVYDLSEEGDEPHTLINPEISDTSSDKECMEEGCLSFPDVRAEVKRSKSLTLKGFDEKGEPISLEVDGLMAVMIQHEVDHLDGISFVDRLNTVEKMRIKKDLRALEEA